MDGSQTPRESFEEMKKLYDEMVELKKELLEMTGEIKICFDTLTKQLKKLL